MILCVPKQQLSASQKNLLTKKGHIVIECDNPESVRVINPETNIDSNDYYMSALKALTVNQPTTRHENFINELYRRLKANEDIEIIPAPLIDA